MKLTCDMVTDLYPLYKDGLASPDTRDAIKEHLKECDDCRNFYRRYPFQDKFLRRSAADVFDNPTHTSSVTDGFNSFAKKMRRNKKIKIALACLVAAAVAVFAFFKYFMPEQKK
ncbi:MAG: zf-HC2 domain-containing protein [Clostridia bacterium]|nr:zf-HC2 domain-containing protein [Clostridia bacterium]